MIDKAASLTSALLVRKGAARPAPVVGAILTKAAAKVINLNARKDQAVPAARGITSVAGPGAKRIRVSLRLDPERHARLKSVAANSESTLQGLFVAALDEYLADFVDGVEPAHKRFNDVTN